MAAGLKGVLSSLLIFGIFLRIAASYTPIKHQSTLRLDEFQLQLNVFEHKQQNFTEYAMSQIVDNKGAIDNGRRTLYHKPITSPNTYRFILILLVSGDIAENPGPVRNRRLYETCQK